ncbi:2-oxo acid dehydrogenase acyltransferase [Ancylostoma ceylanicum]|uniref:2-oxo acid dehydrogenase acyltransferase n=1 Tax=Ancylostoma ceylanicum TaxID=53326 RepID=A0A0D6LQ59_9BILA|nr:2-oxo acid dehydrogenase acyltransferase [Ancylostoma ceylanicum]
MLHYGINEKDVKATGPKNNILKSDVFGVIKAGGLKPVVVTVAPPPEPAALAVQKQLIPHEYQSAVVRADAVLAIQAELRSKDIAVSLNDFIIKAAALALRAVPEVNVQYSAESQQVNYLPMVDVSVAVATPSGLITPIITSADILGVQDISARVKELAKRARENKLQPNEFQGGTFTISNLGMFGSVEQFTAIINPPQAAILAVGGTRTELDENFKPLNKFTVTLCFDARAITETSARRFLDHFSASLSDPDFMVAEPIDPALNFDFARLL